MNDEIVESFSRKSLAIGTRKTVTIYLNVAGTLMFLAHPATERGEARESKSVAPSRHRTPRQDHSRKSTLSRRSAKTKWLSDPESGISPNNCLRDGTVKNALQSCKFRRMILEMLTNLNPRCDFASCCCTCCTQVCTGAGRLEA